MAGAYNPNMSRAVSFLGLVLGYDELLLVGVVVFLHFAGRKLPQIGHGLRIGLREFKPALRQMDKSARDVGRSAGGVLEGQATRRSRPITAPPSFMTRRFSTKAEITGRHSSKGYAFSPPGFGGASGLG